MNSSNPLLHNNTNMTPITPLLLQPVRGYLLVILSKTALVGISNARSYWWHTVCFFKVTFLSLWDIGSLWPSEKSRHMDERYQGTPQQELIFVAEIWEFFVSTHYLNTLLSHLVEWLLMSTRLSINALFDPGSDIETYFESSSTSLAITRAFLGIRDWKWSKALNFFYHKRDPSWPPTHSNPTTRERNQKVTNLGLMEAILLPIHHY